MFGENAIASWTQICIVHNEANLIMALKKTTESYTQNRKAATVRCNSRTLLLNMFHMTEPHKKRKKPHNMLAITLELTEDEDNREKALVQTPNCQIRGEYAARHVGSTFW